MNDMRYIRKKMHRDDGHKEILRKHRQRRGVNTYNRYQQLSMLETIREDDEAEEPIFVIDKSNNGKWIREEAVVDSGSVECVTSKKRMLHLRVEGTPESRRGETWTCAGGNEIKKEGKVTLNWRTDWGTMNRGVFKVGPVSRTQISVDRLQETGHDVILTKNKPRIVNLRTGEVMPLRKDGGVFSFSTCGSGCRRVARKQKDARILHDRGKSSHRRPRKSMFRSSRQTGCWRRMQKEQGPSQPQDRPGRKNVRSTRQHTRSTEAGALHA